MDKVFTKSHWMTESDSIRAAVPITKVDAQRRVVSGFATLDNQDVQQDIVPIDASKQAFARFRGNVREMHMPIAVGKVIDFKDEDYYDKETNKVYRGIYVDVYISKGSEDTWQKILDNTLTGFSIGGSINEDEIVYDPVAEKAVRVIKSYELTELSLVDNPANQLANIVSISKSAEGALEYDGMLAKMETEDVLWCERDNIVRLSQGGKECPVCATVMESIGFVESDDVEKENVIRDLFKQYQQQVLAADAESASNDVEAIEKEESIVAENEEAVEKSATDLDVPDDGADFAKAVEDIGAVATAVGDLTTLVKDASAAQAAEREELTKAVQSLQAEINSLAELAKGLDSRLEAVEADTAVRKSGDLGEVAQEEKIEKSIWNGAFLRADGLFR